MPASLHAEHLESCVLHIYKAAIELTVLAQQESDVIRNSQSCWLQIRVTQKSARCLEIAGTFLLVPMPWNSHLSAESKAICPF